MVALVHAAPNEVLEIELLFAPAQIEAAQQQTETCDGQ
jgi:hypothetical protein